MASESFSNALRESDGFAMPLEPEAVALIRFGVELVIEAYQRDPQATLARLADVTYGDERFQTPVELLDAEEI